MSTIKIIDSTGKEELFSAHKLERSLKKAGASNLVARQIAQKIENQIKDGVTTSEIFKIARQELSKEQPQAAVKFNLKLAMRNLGPDGFSFEKYVKQLFVNYGFSVKTNQYIPGRCVAYETDIVAEDEDTVYFGECKYHNQAGIRVDLTVCMKIFAAAMDVCENYFKDQIKVGKKIIPIVITNAKFTTQAIKYSECQGIKLLGWNYPKNNGLEKMIETKKLYPITILPSFKSYAKEAFGEVGVILAKDLLEIKDIENFSKKIGLPVSKITILIKEAEMLSNGAAIVKSF
ncbi:MAG: ATP cone domain-containing protein [Candidatus Paceibacterota bacterium]|jgi:hypothetical protein